MNDLAQTAYSKLNDKQKRFVDNYCLHFNGTRAALEAKYSKSSAHSIAHENLRKPEIRNAIEERLQQIMGANELKSRVAEIAAGSMEDFITLELSFRRNFCNMSYEDALKWLEGERQKLTDSIKEFEGKKRLSDNQESLLNAQQQDYWALGAELARLQSLDEDKRSKPVRVLGILESVIVEKLDLQKAEKLGKLHLIKKLSYTKYGPSLELYSAFEAQQLLGKHYALWTDKIQIDDPHSELSKEEKLARLMQLVQKGLTPNGEANVSDD